MCQGCNGGLNFRWWQSWLFTKAVCTCGGIKDNLNGDDVKKLRDLYFETVNLHGCWHHWERLQEVARRLARKKGEALWIGESNEGSEWEKRKRVS